MNDVRDSAQYRVVKDKVDAELARTLKQIPKSMPKILRDKILYNMMTTIQKEIKIPK